MSDHLNIEELFRSKLENAELTPSKGVWKGLQRKLKIRQFLRFKPGRFNAWYAGALLVAGAAAVTLLNTTPERSANREESGRQVIEALPATNSVSTTREETGKNRTGGVYRETGPAAGAPDRKMQDGTTSGRGEGTGEGRWQGIEQESEPGEQQVVAAEHPEVGEADPMPGVSENVKDKDNSEEPESATGQLTLVPWFTASVTRGCAPLEVTFYNESVNATSVSWNFGNGEASTKMTPVTRFEEAGTYAVSMNVTGSGGQAGTYHEVIRVFPSPEAGFEIGEGLAEPDGTPSMELMNYSTGGFSCSWELLRADGTKQGGWSSNAFQPTLNSKEIPDDARLIRMVVVNEHGCTDTAFAGITALTGGQRTLTFPTAFSASHTGPNGGHYNLNDMRVDVFHPHYTEEPAEYHLQLFSKMGEIVFETRDIHQGWDGYYMQERAAGGVYLWMAGGTWPNGASFNLKGDVTLLWSDRH